MSGLPATAAREVTCGTGHRIAALYVSPDGTYEIRYSITGIPAVLPRNQDNASVPARRPLLRLVEADPAGA